MGIMGCIVAAGLRWGCGVGVGVVLSGFVGCWVLTGVCNVWVGVTVVLLLGLLEPCWRLVEGLLGGGGGGAEGGTVGCLVKVY